MPETPNPRSATVRELLSGTETALALRVLAGAQGLDNPITSRRVQKPGLALTGFVRYVRTGRVQVLGKSELAYLAELPPERKREVLEALYTAPITCLVLTTGLAPPSELVQLAESNGVPLLQTGLPSDQAIEPIVRFLAHALAPCRVEHGVMLDVYGLGVLITGDSGVGKSECALDLIVRGHRLVSDDSVEIRRMGGNLVCCGPDLTRYHMELRGLGIINIKDLFGVAAVRHQKNLEMVVRLDPWKEGKEYDRLGVDQQQYEILGMKVAYMEMPVAPGRNLSMLIEVACRNQLLKLRGYHPAQELARRLNERIGREEQRQEKGQGPVPAEEPADIAMSVTPDGAADELSPMDEDLEDDG